MRYAAIAREFTRRKPYLGASAAARGAWGAVLVYASDIEGDRIVGARGWVDREWLATCDVERADLDLAIERGLLRWIGDDLFVEGFDYAGLAKVVACRENGAKSKGRPVTKPNGIPRGNPKVSPRVTNRVTQAKPNKGRKRKVPRGAVLRAPRPDLDAGKCREGDPW